MGSQRVGHDLATKQQQQGADSPGFKFWLSCLTACSRSSQGTACVPSLWQLGVLSSALSASQGCCKNDKGESVRCTCCVYTSPYRRYLRGWALTSAYQHLSLFKRILGHWCLPRCQWSRLDVLSEVLLPSGSNPQTMRVHKLHLPQPKWDDWDTWSTLAPRVSPAELSSTLPWWGCLDKAPLYWLPPISMSHFPTSLFLLGEPKITHSCRP